MAFDDLPLDRPPAPLPPSVRPAMSGTARWLIVGAAVVILGALLTLRWLSRAQPPTAIPPPVTVTDPTQAYRRPSRQALELPSLVNSDAMLREFVSQLSRHPLLARFLATKDLVRGVTLAIVQIGDGRTPAAPLAVLRPPVRLEIGPGTSGKVDPQNFARWDTAVRALHSIPAADAAQVYVNVKPLFDEAYRELGYPSGDFDEAIVKAIRMLKATPDVPQDLLLLKRDGYFEHEDAALRSLPPAQKQLILMGPANRRLVLAWLQQIAATLELRIQD